MLTRSLIVGLMIAWFGSLNAGTPEYQNKEILFCLKSDRMPLSVSRQGKNLTTNYAAINRLLSGIGVEKIEQWLPMADERDVIDGVRLSHIYRVVFKDQKSMDQLTQIVQKFRLIEDVHSAALEAVNRVSGSFEPYIPGDPYFNRQWYLENIGAPRAWGLWRNSLPGDSTVLVGVVDTGLDYTHPDLKNVMFINPGEDVNGDGKITAIDSNGVDDDGNGYVDDFKGWDFANEDNDVRPPQAGPSQELSHGTHVAGIIAALTDNGVGISGISFRSKLIVTKHAKDSDLSQPGIIKGYQGVLYCAKLGAKIINCSWGGGYDFYGKLVVDNVTQNYGAIVVAAAGNDGHNNDDNPQYPSDYDNAVCVASVRIDDKKAYYSNFGTVVDISAPGGEGSSYATAILSTIHANAGSYASWQGTSMASPVVAGALALLKAWFPNDSRDQLLQRLYNAADPIDDVNPSYRGLLGRGRVNVFNAIAREILPSISLKSFQFETSGGQTPAPGDTLSLSLTLANKINWQDAYHVRAVLKSSSPYAVVLDSLFWIGELPAGADTILDQFRPRVRIDPQAPLQDLRFQLKITANDTSEYWFENTEELVLTVSLNQTGFPLNGIGLSSAMTFMKDASENKIVGITNQNQLTVYDQNGRKVNGFPLEVDATSAAPVIADLDLDGQKEIITVNRRGILRVVGFDGKIKKEFKLDEPVYGDLVVGNFDADPELEMAFGTMHRNIHIFNLDSTQINGFPRAMSSLVNLGGAVADLNGDGMDDLVIGTFDGKLHVILSNGDSLPGFPVNLSTRVVVNPVIGKYGDSLFIAVATLDNKIVVLNKKGQIKFERALSESVTGGLMLADVNQDGAPEICAITADGRLYLLEADGASFNDVFPLQLNGTPQTAPVSFDVDNDGQLEILTVVNQGVLHLIKLDGREVTNFPVDLGEGVSSVPALGDLDGDGDTEVLVSTQSALLAIDLPAEAGFVDAWNTYQGNNHRTGSFGVPVSAIAGKIKRPLPDSFELLANYPNPFNHQTVIQVNVPGQLTASGLQLYIYNVLGELVFEKSIKRLNAGLNRIQWDGRDSAGKILSSGIYFYRVKIGHQSRVSRLLLIK
ncbi:S8 family serine peptidase [Calditrichota bacterium GD2]